ncbi:hypothetical protein BELL_0129g00070 [Botrytis elliptica]|uniref:SH3 domain-containing protein n=1 Tax=Botrytis elliptica TaxID=278938 RepID=A0A4Z1JT31_9HELO|nr:hypothetical protein EAE99_003218 [Botrytis elliptica]TGO76961.1 hypothetical protein BELL_0129g00070 [Botrytis elliptica]
MGQTSDLGTRPRDTPLDTAINASIFVAFNGFPTGPPAPTDRETKIKNLKRHNRLVRANIVKAFVAEKERLLEKFKDDVAKQKDAIARGRANRVVISIKQDARERKNGRELEDLSWLRGPKWLLELQAQDGRSGVNDVSPQELQNRDRRLRKEMEGHKSEEYEWNSKDFRGSAPESETEEDIDGSRDSEGDVVMGGLDSSSVSPTELSTPSNTTALFELEQKLDQDLQRLLKKGIKKIKEYDAHADSSLKQFKDKLAQDIINGLGLDTTEGEPLKNTGSKTNLPTPSGPHVGILKKKSVSMQTPMDSPANIPKKSVSIQTPLEGGADCGSTSKKSVSIQPSKENGGSPSKKPISIQIPSKTQNGVLGRALVQSPMDITGSASKKVRLDDPFWTGPSSSSSSSTPLSMNTPTSARSQVSFPMNAPTGPAKSRRPSNSSSGPPTPIAPNVPTGPANLKHSRRPSSSSSRAQSPNMPTFLAGSANANPPTPRPSHSRSAPKDSPSPRRPSNAGLRDGLASPSMVSTPATDSKSTDSHTGKSFISSFNWLPELDDRFDLKTLIGDEIEIIKHESGDDYVAFNKTSGKTGHIDIKNFMQDIEPIGLLGSTFISSSRYVPKSYNFYDLEIDHGDEVKITSHHSANAFVGFNMRTKREGTLNAKYYLKDIEDAELGNKIATRFGPTYNDKDDPPISHIGKTFRATDTQSPKHPKDMSTLNIRIGDKIEITNYTNGNTFVGFNKTSKEKGQFNMDTFWKDIEKSSLDLISGPSTSKKNSQNSKHVHVGKTFIASHDYYPRIDAADDLPIRYGDAIELVRHDFGDIFEGYNTRTDRMGLVNILYFKKDINSVGKTGESFSATGSRRSENYSYDIGIPQTDGNNDSEYYPQINPAAHVGKTFISSHSWLPNNGIDLAIRLGDAIEIINDNFEGNYEGYNIRTKKYGRFQARYFQKDIDALDYIGKIFTATSSLYDPDFNALQINFGDAIEITNIIGRDLYTGNNLSTGQMGGKFYIDQFREDAKLGHYAGIDENRGNDEHRHFAGEIPGDHSAHEPRDNDSPDNYINKAFTATSSQSPRGPSDIITLSISIGDMIAINKFVSGSTFRCFNITTGKTGHVKLDNYWKDIEATGRFRDAMDVDSPASRISTPGNLGGAVHQQQQQQQQEQSDKIKFTIKGVSRNLSRGRGSF